MTTYYIKFNFLIYYERFFKNVFANIVAILIILMVIFGFFMLMIFASAMSEDQKPSIENNSVLVLNFKTQF
jgi:protease-4